MQRRVTYERRARRIASLTNEHFGALATDYLAAAVIAKKHASLRDFEADEGKAALAVAHGLSGGLFHTGRIFDVLYLHERRQGIVASIGDLELLFPNGGAIAPTATALSWVWVRRTAYLAWTRRVNVTPVAAWVQNVELDAAPKPGPAPELKRRSDWPRAEPAGRAPAKAWHAANKIWTVSGPPASMSFREIADAIGSSASETTVRRVVGK